MSSSDRRYENATRMSIQLFVGAVAEGSFSGVFASAPGYCFFLGDLFYDGFELGGFV